MSAVTITVAPEVLHRVLALAEFGADVAVTHWEYDLTPSKRPSKRAIREVRDLLDEAVLAQ